VVVIEVAEFVYLASDDRDVAEAASLGQHTKLEDALLVHDKALALDDHVELFRILACFFDNRFFDALKPQDIGGTCLTRLQLLIIALLAVLREHAILGFAVDLCPKLDLAVFKEELEWLVDVFEHNLHDGALESRLQLLEEV
jgi:hypothetical protein